MSYPHSVLQSVNVEKKVVVVEGQGTWWRPMSCSCTLLRCRTEGAQYETCPKKQASSHKCFETDATSTAPSNQVVRLQETEVETRFLQKLDLHYTRDAQNPEATKPTPFESHGPSTTRLLIQDTEYKKRIQSSDPENVAIMPRIEHPFLLTARRLRTCQPAYASARCRDKKQNHAILKSAPAVPPSHFTTKQQEKHGICRMAAGKSLIWPPLSY